MIEFVDFGSLANIHGYFRDKYLKGDSDEAFNARVNHFFGALRSILEGSPAAEYKSPPDDSSVFTGIYRQAFNQDYYSKEKVDKWGVNITPQLVIEYLKNVAQKASNQDLDPREQQFYQIFLAKLALPLLFSSHLSDDDFNTIVGNIPGKMLLDEQEASRGLHGAVHSSLLLLQLRDSTYPKASMRYDAIVARFPAEDSRKAQYSSQAVIFQTLLLSQRPADQLAVSEKLKQIVANTPLMSSILCDVSFLAALGGSNLYGITRGNPHAVFELLSLASAAEFRKNQGSTLVNTFNRVMRILYDSSDKQFPPMRLGILTPQTCVWFFGMLDPQSAKEIYSRKIWGEFSLLMASNNVSNIGSTVVNFISHCLHPSNDYNLPIILDVICKKKGEDGRTEAWLIKAYLTMQVNLYPDSENSQQFKEYLVQLDNVSSAVSEQCADSFPVLRGVELAAIPSVSVVSNTSSSFYPPSSSSSNHPGANNLEISYT